MKNFPDKRFTTNIYLASLYQFCIFLFIFWLTRIIFFFYNAELFEETSFPVLLKLMAHGFYFDLSIACAVNMPFLLLRFIPFPFACKKKYIRVTDYIFYITNSVLILFNFCDTALYRFSNSRLRKTSLYDYLSDDNIANILLHNIIGYWFIALEAVAFILLMIYLYKRVRIVPSKKCQDIKSLKYVLLITVMLCIYLGINNGISYSDAISISEAAKYVRYNKEMNIVLNTPFCIFRSDKRDYIRSYNFYPVNILNKIRDSAHTPQNTNLTLKKNIMLIVFEGISDYYINSQDRYLSKKPLAPMTFFDSILSNSLVAVNTYACGNRSIGGIMALMGGFPSFGNFTYITSQYTGNTIDGLPYLLSKTGYYTALYSGSSENSFSIKNIAEILGFDKTYFKEQYPDQNDYDGSWGIYDHAMGNLLIDEADSLPTPFFISWITLSTHDPYSIPEGYGGNYKNKLPGFDRSVEYFNEVLTDFFEKAKSKNWFKNTIFIFTSDHGTREKLGNDLNAFTQPRIPMIIYSSDKSIKPQKISRPTAQYDLIPTILYLINYPYPFVCMGNNILSDTTNYAINYIDGQFQVIGEKYLVQYDNKSDRITRVYDIDSDCTLSHPLKNYDNKTVEEMLTFLKAFLQDYSVRMNETKFSYSKEHSIK